MSRLGSPHGRQGGRAGGDDAHSDGGSGSGSGGSDDDDDDDEAKDLGDPPRMSRPGYSTQPPMHQLRRMTSAQLQAVHGFSVEREGVGSIEWMGSSNVEGLDLDAIVTIEESGSSVYDGVREVPPPGTRLNSTALVKMYNVAPEDGETPQEFEAMLREYTAELPYATFAGYNPKTREWTMLMSQFADASGADASDDNGAGAGAPSGRAQRDHGDDSGMGMGDDSGMGMDSGFGTVFGHVSPVPGAGPSGTSYTPSTRRSRSSARKHGQANKAQNASTLDVSLS